MGFSVALDTAAALRMDDLVLPPVRVRSLRRSGSLSATASAQLNGTRRVIGEETLVTAIPKDLEGMYPLPWSSVLSRLFRGEIPRHGQGYLKRADQEPMMSARPI
jgi:hypothetical protein